MKPSLNPKTLRTALLIVGTTLVAIGESPQLHGLVPDLYQHLMAIIGTALLGKELLQRSGDIASDELPAEWVEAVERVNAQGQPEAKPGE